MLNIFKRLELFFKDNYKKVHVRKYAKLLGISPPTSSTLLKQMHKEGLLNKTREYNLILYSANRESKLFIQLCRAYWLLKLNKCGLLDYLDKKLISQTTILFGSFSKAEINKNSDIDLAIFSVSTTELSLSTFEKKLGRKIQLFKFKDMNAVKNKELLYNILNGFVICGGWQ